MKLVTNEDVMCIYLNACKQMTDIKLLLSRNNIETI